MRDADKIRINFLKWIIDRSTGYAITNYYLRSNWECDVLVLSKNNFLTEYEIKISVADFKKDFQKKYRWGNGETKHDKIARGHRTNKFFFVTPKNLVDVSTIPEYAGLVEVDDDDVMLVKNAKWLHREKVSEKIYKDIIDKFYTRYLYKVFYPEYRKYRLNVKISELKGVKE